jgi:Methyltransferase FkbM domain
MKNILNRIYPILKNYPTRLTGNQDIQILLAQLRPMKCEKELIRLGPQGDGGYLIPNDLKGITACFSPGVDQISGFELDCANRGMQVFMADYSVEGPAARHRNFYFLKKFLGIIQTKNTVTLGDWVESSVLDADAELLLQMDIEGAEYEVLLGASEDLMKRFRIIVIEFHSLKLLWSEPFFRLASRAFEKLLQTHVCVHNHPNNINPSKKIGNVILPSVTEMTFLRRDRVDEMSPATVFPHPLDYDNSDKRALPLPKCWYT